MKKIFVVVGVLCLGTLARGNVVTQGTKFRVSLDIKIALLNSEGIYDGKSLKGGTSTPGAFVGAKWLMTYPSGFGLGLGLHSLVSKVPGLYDEEEQGAYDENLVKHKPIQYTYGSLNLEYHLLELLSLEGVKAHLNFTSGPAATSPERDKISEDIKESVNGFELGGSYSFSFQSHGTKEFEEMTFGLFYHMVNHDVWSDVLSGPSFSVMITR